MNDSTARAAENGAQPKRSHGLDDARFTIVAQHREDYQDPRSDADDHIGNRHGDHAACTEDHDGGEQPDHDRDRARPSERRRQHGGSPAVGRAPERRAQCEGELERGDDEEAGGRQGRRERRGNHLAITA